MRFHESSAAPNFPLQTTRARPRSNPRQQATFWVRLSPSVAEIKSKAARRVVSFGVWVERGQTSFNPQSENRAGYSHNRKGHVKYTRVSKTSESCWRRGPAATLEAGRLYSARGVTPASATPCPIGRSKWRGRPAIPEMESCSASQRFVQRRATGAFRRRCQTSLVSHQLLSARPNMETRTE